MFDDDYRPIPDVQTEFRRHGSLVLMFAGLAAGEAHTDPDRRIGEITQTSLAAAGGVIRAYIRFRNGKQPVAHAQILLGLLRWAAVQELDLRPETERQAWVTGWLERQPGMRERRLRGNTTRQALAAVKPEQLTASNNSKGAACVPRAAACSLLYPDIESPDGTFVTAAESAATTHGHPIARVASGVFAAALRFIREGNSVPDGLRAGLRLGHEPTVEADQGALADVEHHVTKALDRSAGGGKYESAADFGWRGRTAEQALAIAAWAVNSGGGLEDVLRRATGHGGEQHSTGALAGALWGAQAGREQADRAFESDTYDAPVPQPLDEIPDELLPRGDDVALVEAVAEDLVRILRAGSAIEVGDRRRWPGW
jgi:ADP-ribosylglycohydrolase